MFPESVGLFKGLQGLQSWFVCKQEEFTDFFMKKHNLWILAAASINRKAIKCIKGYTLKDHWDMLEIYCLSNRWNTYLICLKYLTI